MGFAKQSSTQQSSTFGTDRSHGQCLQQPLIRRSTGESQRWTIVKVKCTIEQPQENYGLLGVLIRPTKHYKIAGMLKTDPSVSCITTNQHQIILEHLGLFLYILFPLFCSAFYSQPIMIRLTGQILNLIFARGPKGLPSCFRVKSQSQETKVQLHTNFTEGKNG